MSALPPCPRCDSNKIRKIADSPVSGKWEVYGCNDCNYVWRSSEDLSNLTSDIKYLRDTVVRYWAD
ncbi:MAG: vanillic acid non-oxidative decarboxylation protein [Chloroflexi bacterium]|nr:vanillic acid non-oxidative decarboxylation protein [Chloroflexota bacterium]